MSEMLSVEPAVSWVGNACKPAACRDSPPTPGSPFRLSTAWLPGGSGMTCPRCQYKNRTGAKFCESCGAPGPWAGRGWALRGATGMRRRARHVTAAIALGAMFLGAAGTNLSTTIVRVPTLGATPASLPGELTMPRGAGPFPAVILLHGCVGIVPASRERLLEYASWYADRGYAGLILDSFASRGVSAVCLGGEPNPLTRAFDAYRGLE